MSQVYDECVSQGEGAVLPQESTDYLLIRKKLKSAYCLKCSGIYSFIHSLTHPLTQQINTDYLQWTRNYAK